MPSRSPTADAPLAAREVRPAACRVRFQVPPLSDPSQPLLAPVRPAQRKPHSCKRVAGQRRTAPHLPAVKASAAPPPKAPMSILRLGAAALGMVTMAGCSVFPGKQAMDPTPMRVAPVLRMDSGPVTADAMYAAGKLALLGGQPQNALMNFEQAVLASPAHADARNGKVVALARMGRTDEAMAFAESSLAAGIESAELRANVALLQTWRGKAAAAADRVVAQAAEKPAAPAAVAQTSPVVASGAPVVVAPAAPAAVADVQSALKWMKHGPNVLELGRQSPAAPVEPLASTGALQPATDTVPMPLGAVAQTSLPASAALVEAPAVAEPAKVSLADIVAQYRAEKEAFRQAEEQAEKRAEKQAEKQAQAQPEKLSLPVADTTLADLALEISNGAGRLNLARDTAQALSAVGLQTRRLTNHVNYRVQKTEIHYRGAEHLAQAQRVARTLSVDATLVESTVLRRDINVKVVMGGDAVSRLADALPLVREAPAVASARLP